VVDLGWGEGGCWAQALVSEGTSLRCATGACDASERQLLTAAAAPSPPAPAAPGLREGPPSTLHDRIFENEVSVAVFRAKAAYERLLFREALKVAAYDLGNARDVYRCACVCACVCVCVCVCVCARVRVRVLTPAGTRSV
jgi:hypothetical protein